MDLMVSTSSGQEGFCLIQQFHRECNRSNKLDVLGRTTGNIRSKFFFGSRKRNRFVRVFAASKVESSGLNGRVQKFDHSASGIRNYNGTGHFSSANSSLALEDVESNNHLRQLIRAGELEEGLKFLENMVYHGNVPDIIPCTTLIRGFCRFRGFRRSADINNALSVLDRMNVSPDVVTYNTILRSLCDSGKLKEAMKVLDRQLQRDCYPDVITYTIFIEATCKESGVGQAMKLLDEMRDRGCTPDSWEYV